VRGIDGRKRERRALEVLDPLLTCADDKIRQWAVYGAALAHQGLGNSAEAEKMASNLRRSASNRFFQYLADELTATIARLRDEERRRTSKTREPERAAAMSGPDRDAALRTIDAFRRAVEAADLDGCLALLDGDFRYRDVIDTEGWKNEFGEMLREAGKKGTGLVFHQSIISVRQLPDGRARADV
jgi:hypothetical protein